MIYRQMRTCYNKYTTNGWYGAFMTSKEIIKRLIAHDAPPRFGYDLYGLSDIHYIPSRSYMNLSTNPYADWGEYPELKKLTGFSGEVRQDIYGNIYGRFYGKTKGECIRGSIQDWDDYNYPIYRWRCQQRFFSDRKRVLPEGNNV